MFISRFQPLFTLIVIIAILSLMGCNSEKDDPAQAIEDYIKALSDKDSNRISTLSCGNWEQSALVELDSLTSVESTVENLSCEKTGQEADNVFISCTGALALDYGGELQKIDLSNRTYIAKEEGDEWRMCGYR